MTYNFINSIKGGCGKTTFAIFLEQFLNNQINGNSIILDLDFQGTAMTYLLMGNGAEDPLNKQNRIFVNKAIRNLLEPDACNGAYNLQKGDTMNVICADPRIQEKKKYRATAQTNYAAGEQIRVFSSAFIEYLEKFEDLKYKHIIFDMPPNYDGYADAALNAMLDAKLRRSINGKDPVNLFYLTNIEHAHVLVTVEEIADMFVNNNLRFPNATFIVLNDLHLLYFANEEEEDKQRLYKYLLDVISRKMGEIGFTEGQINRIFVLRMDGNPEYAKAMLKEEGLQNMELKALLPDCPITHYAQLGKDNVFKEASKEWLLKRIENSCTD